MTPDKLALLGTALSNLESAAEHLRVSLERTRGLFGGQSWQFEDLERLESLASRFARLSDLLTQRIMRLVDELELLGGATQLDRIRRAEKRGWVDDAATLVRIRELRNLIANEYAADRLAEIYAAVATLTPDLHSSPPIEHPTHEHDPDNRYPLCPTRCGLPATPYPVDPFAVHE